MDLAVTVTGLPGVPADIKVTSAGGYSQVVTSTATLKGLTPGWYLITAWYVAGANQLFAPTPESLQVELKSPATNVTFAYALASGSLAVGVSGLPSGVNANVAVYGPGYYKLVTSSQTIGDLVEGSYTITGKTAVNGSTTYGGTPYTQTVVVPASTTPVNASVAYAAMTGQIAVTVSGLPGGADPSVLVTGPFGYSHSISANGTTTLSSLPLGVYTVAADSVVAGTTAYFPSAASRTVTLNAGALSSAAPVSYVTSDLTIDGLYITQAVQNYQGRVPMVAGRDGFLRVFVKASRPNHWTPPVRVRWYVENTLVRTDTIAAPGPSVPVTIDEGALNSSWNLFVPGALFQPGLRIVANVDPSNVVAESNESNNAFSTDSVGEFLEVHTIPPAHVTLVPIRTFNGRSGNVDPADVEPYLAFMQKIHPLPGHVGTLHPAVSVVSPALTPDDANRSWLDVLSALSVVRLVESADAGENYYGVVDPPYDGGVIGLGYVGYPVAIGSDRGTPEQTLAHELGHNWGRMHSPCGNPADPDPQYPYPSGNIGVYGYNVATHTLYQPTMAYDIMSYCTPVWVSDYTYTGVYDFLAGTSSIPEDRIAASAPEQVLIVWGHVRTGELVLEPAFEVTARPSLPSGSGAYTVQALDAGGAPLFSYSFNGNGIADEPGSARGFAFAIPLARFDASRLAALELRGGARHARVNARAFSATGLIARLRGNRAEVQWNGGDWPMALVRDARTGQVLAIGRGGTVQLAAPGADLVVTVSNGVRSTTETVHAR